MLSPSATSNIRLDGQVAIITGGGRGIERGFAVRLAAAGARVAIAARSAEQLAETAEIIAQQGGHAVTFPLDVTDRSAVEAMVAQVERQVGPVTLLINNAAVAHPLGPFWELDPDEWWRTLDINVRGTLLCAQAVLPEMIRRGGGRIINVASGAGLGVMEYASAYVTSKAAVIRLSENMAAETNKHNIPVFAIGPGLVKTAMTDYLAYSETDRKWLPWGVKFMESGQAVPPELSAEMVVVLASGRADALSGRFLGLAEDIDVLIQRSEDIHQKDLYMMRLRM